MSCLKASRCCSCCCGFSTRGFQHWLTLGRGTQMLTGVNWLWMGGNLDWAIKYIIILSCFIVCCVSIVCTRADLEVLMPRIVISALRQYGSFHALFYRRWFRVTTLLLRLTNKTVGFLKHYLTADDADKSSRLLEEWENPLYWFDWRENDRSPGWHTRRASHGLGGGERTVWKLLCVSDLLWSLPGGLCVAVNAMTG